MEGERKDCISPVKKYLFIKVVVIALLLVLTAEMGRQALTKEETKRVPEDEFSTDEGGESGISDDGGESPFHGKISGGFRRSRRIF